MAKFKLQDIKVNSPTRSTGFHVTSLIDAEVGPKGWKVISSVEEYSATFKGVTYNSGYIKLLERGISLKLKRAQKYYQRNSGLAILEGGGFIHPISSGEFLDEDYFTKENFPLRFLDQGKDLYEINSLENKTISLRLDFLGDSCTESEDYLVLPMGLNANGFYKNVLFYFLDPYETTQPDSFVEPVLLDTVGTDIIRMDAGMTAEELALEILTWMTSNPGTEVLEESGNNSGSVIISRGTNDCTLYLIYGTPVKAISYFKSTGWNKDLQEMEPFNTWKGYIEPMEREGFRVSNPWDIRDFYLSKALYSQVLMDFDTKFLGPLEYSIEIEYIEKSRFRIRAQYLDYVIERFVSLDPNDTDEFGFTMDSEKLLNNNNPLFNFYSPRKWDFIDFDNQPKKDEYIEIFREIPGKYVARHGVNGSYTDFRETEESFFKDFLVMDNETIKYTCTFLLGYFSPWYKLIYPLLRETGVPALVDLPLGDLTRPGDYLEELIDFMVSRKERDFILYLIGNSVDNSTGDLTPISFDYCANASDSTSLFRELDPQVSYELRGLDSMESTLREKFLDSLDSLRIQYLSEDKSGVSVSRLTTFPEHVNYFSLAIGNLCRAYVTRIAETNASAPPAKLTASLHEAVGSLKSLNTLILGSRVTQLVIEDYTLRMVFSVTFKSMVIDSTQVIINLNLK